MPHKPRHPGARKTKKGPTKGSGGRGRKSLEGHGPTPKAEERPYHVAAKRKAASERRAATTKKGYAPQDAHKQQPRRRETGGDGPETITGRNAVLEALLAKIPASTLYVATGIDMDDRVRKAITLANRAQIAILDVTRPELERLADGSIHQGIALAVPPYEYLQPHDLLENRLAANRAPLLVALDGVTDPRNLGAIIRSTAAFGGDGIIIPQRRSAGVTAAAWRTSAGAAARVPVAMATNLTQTLKALKQSGLFVVGLDASGSTDLGNLELVSDPLVIVIGSEGKGLSRLVAQNCDALVSIPISSATESLNASVAASVVLYDVARRRSAEERSP